MKFKKVMGEMSGIGPAESTYPTNNNKKPRQNYKEQQGYGQNFRCPACGERQKVNFESFMNGTANCKKCKNQLA